MKKFNQLCMVAILVLGLASVPSTGLASGIPVVDASAIEVQIMNVLKQLEEYATQLEEYALQIDQYYLQGEQYADQLKNTLTPAVYVWDQVEKKLNELEILQDRLNYFYSQSENNVDGYFDQLKSVDFWRGSEWNQLDNTEEYFGHYETINDAEMAANFDLMSTAQYYKDNSGDDAAQLMKLQQTAEAAQGRMEAIQASNQLLANQNQQLMEIKNLLAIQANALAQNLNRQQQTEANEIAHRRAAFENWTPPKEDVVNYDMDDN